RPHIGAEVVASIEERDWPRLAACLAPDVVFRAITPTKARPMRELVGPVDTSAQIPLWFHDADIHELVASTVEPIADRLHISYRVRCREDGRWLLVEQQLFATLTGDRIVHLDLLCSGFNDTAPPD